MASPCRAALAIAFSAWWETYGPCIGPFKNPGLPHVGCRRCRQLENQKKKKSGPRSIPTYLSVSYVASGESLRGHTCKGSKPMTVARRIPPVHSCELFVSLPLIPGDFYTRCRTMPRSWSTFAEASAGVGDGVAGVLNKRAWHSGVNTFAVGTPPKS